MRASRRMRVQREGVLLYSPLMAAWRKERARVREADLRIARVEHARDEARAEVARITADLSNEIARLRAQVDAVTALCEGSVRSGIRWLAESDIRAALATGGESCEHPIGWKYADGVCRCQGKRGTVTTEAES
jgi:hypothetical protein